MTTDDTTRRTNFFFCLRGLFFAIPRGWDGQSDGRPEGRTDAGTGVLRRHTRSIPAETHGRAERWGGKEERGLN